MSSLIHPNRRRFLQGSLAGAAGFAFSSQLHARSIGANDDIRLGFIGIGDGGKGRGGNHVGDFGKKKGCRVAAICDADSAVLDIMKAQLAGQAVEYYQDFRKLLENKDIDAVVIATPNHTHTYIAIAAMQAGKHVYVEKPVSHNLWEGRKLVEHAANREVCAFIGLHELTIAHQQAEMIGRDFEALLEEGLHGVRRDEFGQEARIADGQLFGLHRGGSSRSRCVLDLRKADQISIRSWRARPIFSGRPR